MFFITISRQTESLGDEIASLLAQNLGIDLITREYTLKYWLPEIANDYELHMLSETPKFYKTTSRLGITFEKYIEDRLKEIVQNQSVVILGLGSQLLFKDDPNAIHVRIIAKEATRIERIIKRLGLNREEAAKSLELSDRKHKRYISTVYGKDWSDVEMYDLCLNTGDLSVEEAVEILAHMFLLRRSFHAVSRPPVETGIKDGDEQAPKRTGKVKTFVHPAEEEFAKILDMYNIDWQYEPKTFPIEWDADGNITLAFSPDFYLPTFDTFIELTTMDQKYVSVKKKKVRRLKELYPNVNINIVFKRDFHTLIKRFSMLRGDGANE